MRVEVDPREVLLLAKESLEGMVSQYGVLSDKGHNVATLHEKISRLCDLYNLCLNLLGERVVHELERVSWQDDVAALRELRPHETDGFIQKILDEE